MPHIQSISFRRTPESDRVDIDLAGRHFIITGRNGSGKTWFLRDLFENCQIHPELLSKINDMKARLPLLAEKLKNVKKNIPVYKNVKDAENDVWLDIKWTENQIKILSMPIVEGVQTHLTFYDEEFLNGNVSGAKVFGFSADRLTKIQKTSVPFSSEVKEWAGISIEAAKRKFENDVSGDNIEQHLVNLFVRRSLALTEDNNVTLAKTITAWIERLTSQLRVLMEDDTVKIIFNSSNVTVSLSRGHNEKISFQNISSGFSAVFSILFSIILRAEHLKTGPEDLVAIVFIDEIDVHLHVSLQRKILPFFVDLFPKVQFVVTTHSPFVLTSISNAIIYDLDSKDQISDLSLYSAEAVMEGILKVDSSSLVLQRKVKNLDAYTRKKDIDFLQLKKMIDELQMVSAELDDVAKVYLYKALLRLNSAREDY